MEPSSAYEDLVHEIEEPVWEETLVGSGVRRQLWNPLEGVLQDIVELDVVRLVKGSIDATL